MKKNILLFNFSNLQSEGLILLFERNEIYKVELLSTTSEFDTEKISRIEKIDVLINGNLEKTENTSQTLMLIKSKNPGIKIITIGKNYDQELIEALSFSDVFLDESIDFGFLIKAIETVISDGYFIDQKAAQNYIKLLNDEKQKHTHLTRREVEVLRLICSDKTSKEIGSIMNISSRTVENHRENLLKKTSSRGTAGLLIYSIKNNLLNISIID